MIPGMGSFIIFLLLFVSSVNGIEYSHTELLDGEAYKAHWRFNNETAIFYFKVEVNASGWLGFGVSKLLFPPFEGLEWNRKSMDHYDVIVGGVDSGTEYYKDYMTDGHVHPTPDTKQEPDWNVTSLTETGGWTVMEFERKQSTSDIDDHVIGPGRRWIVWSYHNSSDVTGRFLGWEKHTAHGHYEIDFLPRPVITEGPTLTETTVVIKTESPTIVETPVVIKTETPTSGALACLIVCNFDFIIFFLCVLAVLT